MAGKLQKFQTVMFSGWKSEVNKANHISAIYGLAPQKVSNTMVQLLSRNYGTAGLEYTLKDIPVKEFESDDDYTWNLIGSARRNIPLLEARDIKGNKITFTQGGDDPLVGMGGERFYLVFAEDMFFRGEVLHGSLNEVYPIRVMEDPKFEGTNAVYECEAFGCEGIPSSKLQFGERFSHEYSPVSRGLSRELGGVRFVTPASMRNEWSTIRKKVKVSGDLLDKKVAVGIPMVREDANTGKMVTDTATLWMHYVELQFEKEWNEEKNNVLAYGVTTRNANGEYTHFDRSGEVIRAGEGLYQQMKRGNIYYYNKFSLRLLDEIISELCAGKIEPARRKFTIKTGEFGAIAFSRAAQDVMSGWTQYDYSGDALGVVSKNGKGYTLKNPLFTKWISANGAEVTVEIDPSYDDPIQNKIPHPDGGVANSYRYDIFDFGSTDEPNIFKVALKGKPEYRGYQWGMRNPFTGAMDNFNMSYDEDSAVMHRMTTMGICVLDPTRTVSLIPRILNA